MSTSIYELTKTVHYRNMSSSDPAGKVVGTLEEAVDKAIELARRHGINNPIDISIILNDKLVGVVDQDLFFKPMMDTDRKEESKSSELSSQLKHAISCTYWQKKEIEKRLNNISNVEVQLLKQLECDKSNSHYFQFTEPASVRYNQPDGWHSIKCSNCGLTTHVNSDFDIRTLNGDKLR